MYYICIDKCALHIYLCIYYIIHDMVCYTLHICAILYSYILLTYYIYAMHMYVYMYM